MAREEIRENNQYCTIVGGSFRVQVDKDDPKAVRRDWTSGDGTKSGTRYERIFNALVGYIEDRDLCSQIAIMTADEPALKTQAEAHESHIAIRWSRNSSAKSIDARPTSPGARPQRAMRS